MIDNEFLQRYLNSRDSTIYLSIDNLIDNSLYLIHARNAFIGVYDADRKGFWILRHKFEEEYLFFEYHWDSSDRGTVKPIEFVEKCSIPGSRWKDAIDNCLDPELINYLKEAMQKFT